MGGLRVGIGVHARLASRADFWHGWYFVRARSARTPNRDDWVIWLCVGGARARSARAQAAVAPPWLMLRGDGGKCVRARSARTPIRAGASMWQRVGARARAERARLACVTWHMTWHSGLQVGWPNGRAPAPQRESGATGVWLGVVLCVWQLARCVWVGMAARSAAKTINGYTGTPKTINGYTGTPKTINGYTGYRSLYLSHAKRALYHLSYVPLQFSACLPVSRTEKLRFIKIIIILEPP